MRHFGLQVRRQIDDVYGAKWTFLDADTTADAQPL